MKEFSKAVKAEMIKQHKVYFHSKMIYVSLFVWPMLLFITSYYSYKPFNIGKSVVPYLNEHNLLIFILLGYMSMSFFRMLVQSAWNFSFERLNGTLEFIYLSPVNRFAVILGNALSSLFEGVWVMVVFSVFIFIMRRQYFNINGSAAIISFLLMMVMAVMWGIFLNSIFLFSRDSGFLFTILEEPMEIFSGVKVPTTIFPLWAKAISYIFPLTYALDAMRRVFLNGEGLYEIRGFIAVSIFIVVLLIVVVNICLKQGEKHAKKTGNMTLF
ncbi:ABC transporter permease [Clostridium oryzae]|uniref:Transport permease protein n=1 Tax=Clostridium oryzae TaxID=1450648 RepID=A0A1V4IT37_9CLOT|nr:ABC transporter permease [Clostridium oryzae]OPJ63096.1 ABC-2 type transporter [Clostridium oryzae]